MAWLICTIPAYTTSYSYDGQTLIDDGTWSYSWQHGRQLKQMSRPDASGETEMIRFRYDSSGHRIGKDSGIYHISYSGGEIVYAGETTRTSYSYLGDTLTQINISAPTGSSSLHFTYDELGPMSVTYSSFEFPQMFSRRHLAVNQDKKWKNCSLRLRHIRLHYRFYL